MSFKKGDFWIHAPYVICSNHPHSADREFCKGLLQKNFPEDNDPILVFLRISFDEMVQELCAQKNTVFLMEEVPFFVDAYDQPGIYKTISIWADYYKWTDVHPSIQQIFPNLPQDYVPFNPINQENETSKNPKEVSHHQQQHAEQATKTSLQYADFSVLQFGKNTERHTLVKIPPGSFMMGYHTRRPEGYSDPTHKVHITKPFWMAAYPVAQIFYQNVMRNNPSQRKSKYCPVENVSWCEAVIFCNRLSELEGLECAYTLPSKMENTEEFSNRVRWNQEANGYRLPTEAEREYCARAGTTFPFSGGESIDDVCWYKDNCGSNGHAPTTKDVGGKAKNKWDLYDMSGNVLEWVWDNSIRYYRNEVLTNPVGVTEKTGQRMYRGGGANSKDYQCTVSYRRYTSACRKQSDIGFRLVRGYERI